MNWQFNPGVLPLLTIALLSLFIIQVIRQRQRGLTSAPGGAPAITGLLVAVALWCLAYALELAGPTPSVQVFFARLEYLSISAIPLLFLWFVLTFTRQSNRLERQLKRRLTWLALEPAAILLLVWSNDYHHLIWTAVEPTQVDRWSVLVFSYGLFFWVHVTYAYALLVASALLIWRYLASVRGMYRRQAFIILSATLFPWLGNFLYLSGLNPFPTLDLTPFGFFLSGALSAWGIFAYRLLDVMPLAREVVLDNLQAAVLVIDENDRIIDLNPAARQYISPQAGIGRPTTALLAPWIEMLRTFRDLAEGSAEVTIPLREGARTFAARISPLYHPPGRYRGRVILAYDITERKQMEEELVEAKELAETGSQAKSQFLTNISHELRTPMSIIMGYTELLQERLSADPTSLDQLEKIHKSAQGLLRLINDLLDFSTLETGREEPLRREWFSLAPLLDDLRTDLLPLLEQKHNHFDLRLANDPGQMRSDPQRLRQLLTQLLDNANRFTQNGSIYLEVERNRLTTNDKEADWLIFRVSDTGIGMSPEQIMQIFQPFYQVDISKTQRERGAGLGLAISRHIVRRLGGDLSASSQPGQGSTFVARLPVETPLNLDILM